MKLLLLSLVVSTAQEPIHEIERKILAALPAYTEIKREPIRGVTGGVWLRVLGKVPERVVGSGGQGAGTGTVSKGDTPPPPVKYEPQEIQIILTPGRPTGGGLTFEFKHDWFGVRHRQYTEAAFLGLADGYQWHANMPLYEQHMLAEKVGLGCDDRCLARMAKGLFITDENIMTANSVMGILAEKGERSVPVILVEMRRSADKDPWRAITTIGNIKGELATDKLREWYWSVDTKLSDAAAYGLAHRPEWREAAKSEYIDMLERQRYIPAAIKAAEEFKWEIKGQLKGIIDKPANLANYKLAYWELREAEGTPLKALTEAEKLALLEGRDKFAEAEKIILSHPDKEGAALSAQFLATAISKKSMQALNAFGKSLLEQLPPDVVELMNRKLVKP